MASIFFPSRNIILLQLLVSMIHVMSATAYDRSFKQNYAPLWGFDHFKLLQQQDDEAQLVLDKSSGAGFKSKLEYESGRFHMRIKIPKQKSGGLVPNFYLISRNSGNHTELDFEFIGTEGVLQTNVFASDAGKREQSFKLWFDPSEDFHSYTILWNQHQIVFFVDDYPVTVFKNLSAKGAKFPTEAMHIEATVWNASGGWAGYVNWALAPFTTYYRSFTIDGCPADGSHAGKCHSPELEWNKEVNWDLNPSQKQKLEEVRSKHMLYDYCQNKNAGATFPEWSVGRHV